MTLGQKIIIDHKLKRVVKPYDKPRHESKIWEKQKTETKECILIGIRTLSNGVSDYSDGYCTYEPKEYLKAYLVVESINRKPFFVLIES